jgi:pSer/pThr/pTyr-binding forkhead associated (FHA) protein
MSESPQDPPISAVPFLLYHDRDDRELVHRLDPARPMVTIGRADSADISLPWDGEVSRLHARLELVGDDPAADWTVVDDGLSRNGSFVNGNWVRGRARLRDGDTLCCGHTLLVFRAPVAHESHSAMADPTTGAAREPVFDSAVTYAGPRHVTRASLSDVQRRVLEALARRHGEGHPATDVEIAAELFLAPETVKRHLDDLAARLGLESVPEDTRRARLVKLGLQTGLVPWRQGPRPPG